MSKSPTIRTGSLIFATSILLAGCRTAPEVRKLVPTPRTITEVEAKRIATFAEKGLANLRKQGVSIGKLDSYGNSQPVFRDGKAHQDFSLHYPAMYRARPVAVNAWIQLVTEKGQARVWRGQVSVSDAERDDFLKVAL